jgi:hypothetical protein
VRTARVDELNSGDFVTSIGHPALRGSTHPNTTVKVVQRFSTYTYLQFTERYGGGSYYHNNAIAYVKEDGD